MLQMQGVWVKITWTTVLTEDKGFILDVSRRISIISNISVKTITK